MLEAAYKLDQCPTQRDTTSRVNRTPEVARMMVDMSSVVFWPWKSCAKSELLIQVNPIGDIRFGPLIALVLAGESRRPCLEAAMRYVVQRPPPCLAPPWRPRPSGLGMLM